MATCKTVSVLRDGQHVIVNETDLKFGEEALTEAQLLAGPNAVDPEPEKDDDPTGKDDDSKTSGGPEVEKPASKKKASKK